MSKLNLTPDVIVRIEKSGNRYNAWDTDGVKRTSEITSGCRKNAYNGGYLLGRFPSTASKSGFAWRKVSDGMIENTPSPVNDNTSVEVPTDHAEILNFIQVLLDVVRLWRLNHWLIVLIGLTTTLTWVRLKILDQH
jgi:hypothetical protein